MPELFKEFRCKDCRKLLGKGALADPASVVEIKCKWCKEMNTFKGKRLDADKESITQNKI